MKSIKWMMPLVVTSVLIISGCSQMQQSATPANSANRLTTGNAVGSGLSRGAGNGVGSRFGVTTGGSALGSGTASRFGSTTSRLGGSSSRLGGATTAGIGGTSSRLGGRTTSSFGGATTGAYGSGRGTLAGGGSGRGTLAGGGNGSGFSSGSGIGGSLSSRGFGNTGAGGSASGRLGSGSLDSRLGANGVDNRLGGNGSGIGGSGIGGSGVGGARGGSGFDNRIGGGAGGDYKVTDLNDSSSVLSRRVIYFAYDQSTIEPEYFEILDAHSELLASNPNLTIRLEGHADERGSREYNVALSERRAKAVKQFMDLKGVGSEQSQTVAYGEELPVDPGHNEAAWSKNRRVEIKYIGR